MDALASYQYRTRSWATSTHTQNKDTLCRLCRALFKKIDLYYRPPVLTQTWEEAEKRRLQSVTHHETFARLAISAQQECHLCLLFFRPVERELLRSRQTLTSEIMETSYEVNYEINTDNRGLHWDPHLSLWSSLTQGFLGIRLANLERAPHSMGSKYWVDYPISVLQGSTASDACFELARNWLATCMTSHLRCKSAPETAIFKPTRLLLVEGTAAKFSVRLCYTIELQSDIVYITLSHCWGTQNHLKLSRNNESRFLKNIDTRDLSKTFYDAMLITLLLGCQFLWIDSLCIKQDDPLDWSQEARTMGEIYRNSILNVAKVHVRDPGLFTARHSLCLQACKVADHGPEPIYAYPEFIEYNVEWGIDKRLLERAWVVQERALAPRTLFYSSEMMYWECLQSTASETKPDFFVLEASPELLETSVKQLFTELLRITTPGDSPRWHSSWWKLIYLYTKCELTFVEDRWVAISGLAKSIQQHTGDAMIAGLWRRHLLREMCWKAMKRSTRLNAPSWSWLAVSSWVENTWSSRHSVATASIVSAPTAYEVPYRRADLSLLIPITIEGLMYRFKSGRDRSVDKLFITSANNRDMEGLVWPGWVGTSGSSTSAYWCPDRNVDEEEDLWALQLFYKGTWCKYGKSKLGRCVYEGLVIAKVTEKHWCRAGYFNIGLTLRSDPEDVNLSKIFGSELSVSLV